MIRTGLEQNEYEFIYIYTHITAAKRSPRSNIAITMTSTVLLLRLLILLSLFALKIHSQAENLQHLPRDVEALRRCGEVKPIRPRRFVGDLASLGS